MKKISIQKVKNFLTENNKVSITRISKTDKILKEIINYRELYKIMSTQIVFIREEAKDESDNKSWLTLNAGTLYEEGDKIIISEDCWDCNLIIEKDNRV